MSRSRILRMSSFGQEVSKHNEFSRCMFNVRSFQAAGKSGIFFFFLDIFLLVDIDLNKRKKVKLAVSKCNSNDVKDIQY